MRTRKFDKKTFAITTMASCFIAIMIFQPSFVADIGDLMSAAIAKIIVLMGNAIGALMGMGESATKMDMSMAKLIFNADSMNAATNIFDLNLTLLRDNAINKGVMTLFEYVRFVAFCVLTFSGLWFTLDFLKTADNIQHKKELQTKITRLLIALVILANLNVILETLLVINQVLLDSLRLLINSIVPSGLNLEGPFLMDVFKELADPKGPGTSIPMAIAYLGSAIMNLWLIIFYMIRDLTISFLYIFAPIMIILIPHKLDMFLKWFKEIASNIFTQTIHGVILAIILACASGLSGETVSFYDQLFCLVAFCMFIPLTSMIKGLLGLEGEFGAAKSSAGVGGVMAAAALTGAVVSMAKAGGQVIDSARDYGNSKSELKNFEKGVPQPNVRGNTGAGAIGSTGNSITGNGLESVDTSMSRTIDGIDRSMHTPMTAGLKDHKGEHYNASNMANQLKGQKRMARRKLIGDTLGAVGGAIGGASMGVGMSMLNPFAGAVGAKVGSEAGGYIGNRAGQSLDDIGQSTGDNVQNLAFGEGIRYDGIQRNRFTPMTEGIGDAEGFSGKFNVVKGNVQSNWNRASNLRGNEEALGAEHQAMFGLDKNSMTSENYQTELKAQLNRQTHEQRGNFDKAFRKYSSKSYNRYENNDSVFEQRASALKDKRKGDFDAVFKGIMEMETLEEQLNVSKENALDRKGFDKDWHSHMYNGQLF